MALCTVTGAVYLPSGELARSTMIKFTRVDKSVNAEYLGAVVPADVFTKTDRLGQVDFEILTGRYTMHVAEYSGGAVVPDALTANIADILTIVTPGIPVPAWLTQALAARDEAVDSAAAAAGSALSIQTYASYAAAMDAAPTLAATVRVVSANVNGTEARWVRQTDGTALGGGWAPAGDATPEHWGAVGDGIADDTAAVQAWASAGGVGLPAGRYRLMAAINFPRPAALRGAGMGITVLDWPAGAASRGITVTAGTDNRPTTVESLSLLTGGDGTGTALLIDYSGNISGGNIQPRTTARVRLRDVQMKGSGTVLNSGWLHHVDVVSALGVRASGCAVEGRGSGGLFLSQSAYRVRGEGSPVEIVLDGCWAYQVADAVVSDRAEGLFVDKCNFVAVGRGLVFTSTGQEPQCQVSDSHIAAYAKCIDIDQCTQANIHHNLLYSRDDTTGEVIGVDVSATCLSVLVGGNIFVRTGTSTMRGIRDSGDRTRISGNVFTGVTVGIDVLAGSRNAVERGNSFLGATTQVQSASSTLHRGSLIESYAGSISDLASSAVGTTSLATMASGASGIPANATTGGSFVRTTIFDVNAAYQEFDDFATGRQFFRAKKGGAWGEWQRVSMLPAAGPQDLTGTGTPEGAVAASIGSTYRRTDGGAGTTLYVKESGTGATGWVAK